MFLVDISGSMNGDLIENVKNALMASLFKLDIQDSFNIIAFNGRTQMFSSRMEQATKEAISRAAQWMSDKFIPDGGTNILLPLQEVSILFPVAFVSFS